MLTRLSEVRKERPWVDYLTIGKNMEPEIMDEAPAELKKLFYEWKKIISQKINRSNVFDSIIQDNMYKC